MRRWALTAAVMALLAAAAGYYAVGVRADARAQDCGDWINETNDRVQTARSLLYPQDRPGSQSTGSAQGDAQELFALYEEQLNANPPDAGAQLHDDLLEALSVGAEGLAGSGAAAPETQIVFAKSIIYNSDARLLAVGDTC